MWICEKLHTILKRMDFGNIIAIKKNLKPFFELIELNGNEKNAQKIFYALKNGSVFEKRRKA